MVSPVLRPDGRWECPEHGLLFGEVREHQTPQCGVCITPPAPPRVHGRELTDDEVKAVEGPRRPQVETLDEHDVVAPEALAPHVGRTLPVRMPDGTEVGHAVVLGDGTVDVTVTDAKALSWMRTGIISSFSVGQGSVGAVVDTTKARLAEQAVGSMSIPLHVEKGSGMDKALRALGERLGEVAGENVPPADPRARALWVKNGGRVPTVGPGKRKRRRK